MIKKSITLAAGVIAAALLLTADHASVPTPDELMERAFPYPTAPTTLPGTEGILYAPTDAPSEAPMPPTTAPGTAFILLPVGSRIYTDCTDIHGSSVEGEGTLFEAPTPQVCRAFTHELSRIGVHSLEQPPTKGEPGLDAYIHATDGDFLTVTAEEVDGDV